MKRLAAAAVVVCSLSLPVFAQGAPPPPAPKGSSAPAPAPAGNAAPAPKSNTAPAPAPAPAPAAAAPAPAPNAAPAPAPAAAAPNMGPAFRKPTREAQTKKDIEAFIKAEDALLAKKDYEGLANRADYPVYMVTDTLAGVPSAMASTKEQYVADMKPFWEMMPPGSSTKHKLTISVLSDSLANVVDDYEMTMGKQKTKARNASVVVKVNGEWKYKMMVEAGWGDSPGGAAAAPAPTVAPTPNAQGNRPPPPPSSTGSAPPPPPAKGGTAAPAPAPAGGNNAPPPPKR